MLKFLFTVIILFFLGYYLLKAVIRILSIFFVSGNNSEDKRFRSKDGNVTIEHKEYAKKRFDKDSGEYVDYEEIK